MSAFDPDEFLSQTTTPTHFDPDAFLGQTVSDTAQLPEPTLGATSTGAFHAVRHLGVGLGDKVMAAEQAVSDLMHDKTGRVSFGDAYRRNLAFNDKLIEASDVAHPTARWTGNILGVGGNMAAMAAVGPARAAMGLAQAAPTVGKLTLGQLIKQGVKQGAKLGAAFGAIGGYGADRSDSTLGTVLNTGLGAGLGAGISSGLGAVLPLAARGLGGLVQLGAPLARLIRGGYVRPTPEARALTSRGVNLTLGQMDPGSLTGRIEELAAKQEGGALGTLRNRAVDEGRDVLLAQAKAAGAKPPTRGAPVTQQLEELREGFSKLYDDALSGVKIQPEKYLGEGKWQGLLTDPEVKGVAQVEGLFERAANNKGIDADPAVRGRALAWLTNKAKALMPETSGPDMGTVDAKSVQALRTQLRDKLRSLGHEGEDRSLREIYDQAEKSVTELLESQLPADKLGALKSADTSYRNLLAIEDAAKRAFVNGKEFTPAQLLQAIRSRGSTPELEELARNAQSVFSANYPPTGIQAAVNARIPVLRAVGPAWLGLANTSPTLRAHALHQSAPGLASRSLAAIGRGAETVANSPIATSSLGRSLSDLFLQSLQDENVSGGP